MRLHSSKTSEIGAPEVVVEAVLALGTFARAVAAYVAHLTQDFTKLFHDEAMYYARWKEFKSNTKDDEDDGGPDDVELSDDLVDELDMFASYESMELNAFQQYFLVCGSESSDFSKYTRASSPYRVLMQWRHRKRSTNFMAHTKPFLDWLGLPAMSKACIEFLNFVVYNKYGALDARSRPIHARVELAG
ncbi:hypothetical protein DYB32_004456 [Aphanomyces invadans]|uniref:Uncharacterized protein n=1 Tax=Aphanomyces invadans TaxID=157072 RepID=A0A3R6VBP0_9STRA|nr:hypothetical protein DYB32_004456 [Aphanomyces invadans]